ncbi:MAG: hypothetical protein WCK99_13950 [Mycobacteriaceae bacterium]
MIFIGPRSSPHVRIAIPSGDFVGRRANVGDESWFYHDDEEWAALAERLKLISCPHCKATGTLIRHGFLRGFDDACPPRRTVRARRIFCSNRHRRPGCGRTFSVWIADKIRRRCTTTRRLWRFLQHAVAGSIADAVRATGSALSDRTWQRLWNRFDRSQSAIRTALLARGPPVPPVPTGAARRPVAAQVLAHLRAAFPHADCPIAAYQQTMRSFFV